MNPDTEKWFRENLVIWPQYKSKTTLTEMERWFFEGVNRGMSYGLAIQNNLKKDARCTSME